MRSNIFTELVAASERGDDVAFNTIMAVASDRAIDLGITADRLATVRAVGAPEKIGVWVSDCDISVLTRLTGVDLKKIVTAARKRDAHHRKKLIDHVRTPLLVARRVFRNELRLSTLAEELHQMLAHDAVNAQRVSGFAAMAARHERLHIDPDGNDTYWGPVRVAAAALEDYQNDAVGAVEFGTKHGLPWNGRLVDGTLYTDAHFVRWLLEFTDTKTASR